MQFKSVLKRERKAQEFDPNYLTKTAQGEVRLYDKIQAQKDDCEIYTCLEKYGCLDRMKLDAKKVYADFTAFKNDTRGMLEQINMAKKMWEDLPFDVRKEFDNNMNTFIKDGEKYLKKKVQELEKQEQVITEPQQEPKGE